MARILILETATNNCSVALSLDGKVISILESTEKNRHSSLLTKFIGDVLANAEISFSNLDAIAVGSGPGSYTGLRIGIASAKGLCYAIDKPLIAIGTLLTLSRGMKEEHLRTSGKTRPFLLCPMIDARRMEVYYALYGSDGIEVRKPAAEIINPNSFLDLLEKQVVIFAGDGAPKCKPALEHHPNAVFIDIFSASAIYMATLAEQKFLMGEFEDLAYFEPFYLKDFVAGKPRVKGLR